MPIVPPELSDSPASSFYGSTSATIRASEPPREFPLSDSGNAERLVYYYGHSLRYCQSWGKWLVWDGRTWQFDTHGRALELTKHVARRIPQEPSEESRERLAQFALYSESHQARLMALKLASSHSHVAVDHRVFDGKPLLLPCLNGTVDLGTGRLREHRREDWFTKLVRVEYDHDARCPAWLAFLDHVTAGDEELSGILQRATGCALTGLPEPFVLVCHGEHASGKSTFLQIIRELLGDFAVAGGVHLALADEHLRGGNRALLFGAMAGRRGQDDPWDFPPSCKAFMEAWRPPQLGANHDGAICCVPFGVRISDEQRDRDLVAKLRTELPGILRWAVQGCLMWQRDGVRLAASTWGRGACDNAEQTLGEFLLTRCTMHQSDTVRSGELYRAYLGWCERGGHQPVSQRALGTLLARTGFSAAKTTGGARVWRGLRLMDPGDCEENCSTTEALAH
jgi:putative DNA primase/helicase